jgi:formate hydrogenlyase transcriptional activator
VFEEMLRLSPDAVIIVNDSGEILDVNTRAEEMFGYGSAELLGQPIELLVPDRFRSSHQTHRREYSHLAHTRPMGVGLELSGRRKDGSEFPVDIMLTPIPMETGQVVLSVVRDVSKQKHAEEALRQTEQQFRTLVESVRDYAIFRLDPEGRIATWNRSAERMKGYSAAEIIGQHFSRFYPAEDAERGKPEEELRVAAARGRLEDEGWRIRKDGSRFWANVMISAIRDSRGQLTGFSKVTRDFTDRKQAEDALLLQLAKSLLSNVDIRELLSAISASIQELVPHDFANIALYDPSSNVLRVQLLGTGNQTEQPDIVIPVENSPDGRAFSTKEPLMLSEIGNGGFAAETYRHLTAAGVKSACWLPLINREHAIGTLAVGSTRASAFTQRDVDILGQVAHQVAAAVDNALAFRQIAEFRDRLREEKQYLEEELNTEHSFDDMIGESGSLRQVLKQVESVAPTEATVLILGETGTGKELVARAIHRLSPRRDRTFIKVNCAAIPSGLLESELFGHEKGAFTGAISQKIGRLELANHGTLFLDEVGDLPLELQPKILRALQEKEIERLGGTRTIPVDVRLVAATNRDLATMVNERQFRSDLYYRLRVFPISVPALRQRRDDIPLLVRYFVDKHSRRLGRHIETIPPDVMGALTRWNWPGNIRELENFIERAVILSRGRELRAPLAELESVEWAAPESSPTLETAEREHILRILRETKGTIGGPKGAAARLGLKRTTLNSKLKKLGIERRDYI